MSGKIDGMRLAVGLATVLVFCFVNSSTAADHGSNNSLEQTLVQAALRAELAGRNEGRNALLDNVVMCFPDCAPARWQRGEVLVGNTWQTVESAQRQAAENESLQQYRKLRLAANQSLSAQVELARWCTRHGLEQQARVHWRNVAWRQPYHEEALKHLGWRWHKGKLMAHEEIERRQQVKKELDRMLAKWRPTMVQLSNAALSGDTSARLAAFDQLAEISTDVESIPALEKYVSQRSEELAQHVVVLLGETNSIESTRSLVRHALFCESKEARRAAARQLADRPLHDFVPILLDALQTPIESRFNITTAPNGDTYYQRFYKQERPYIQHLMKTGFSRATWQLTPFVPDSAAESRRRLVEKWDLDPSVAMTLNRLNAAARSNVANSVAQAKDDQRRIDHSNEQILEQNRSIAFVLKHATGKPFDNDVESWWNWWKQYNEEFIGRKKPVLYSRYETQKSITVDVGILYKMSCFPAGTKVWAQTGLVDIEQIKQGDLVLAQDPTTGEIAFQVVLGTTLRPPTSLLEIKTKSEVIRTTLGHPFWVNCEGWRMAKRLGPGDHLHGLRGSKEIKSVEPIDEEAPAYNLIVENFHSYFVGESATLVHDATSRRPITAVLPGLRATRRR